jgi:hypothetical protein
MNSIRPDFFISAKASSFSFWEISFAKAFVSAMAFSSWGFTSAGRPSQNFLLAMTA